MGNELDPCLFLLLIARVSFHEPGELVDLGDVVILLLVGLLVGGLRGVEVLLKYLKATSVDTLVLDEESCVFTILLFEMVFAGKLVEEQIRGSAVAISAILDLVLIEPGEAVESGIALGDVAGLAVLVRGGLKAMVIALIGGIRFLEGHLARVTRRALLAAEWIVSLEIPIAFHEFRLFLHDQLGVVSAWGPVVRESNVSNHFKLISANLS